MPLDRLLASVIHIEYSNDVPELQPEALWLGDLVTILQPHDPERSFIYANRLVARGLVSALDGVTNIQHVKRYRMRARRTPIITLPIPK